MLGLLEMSFYGSILILVILLVRAFTVTRLPKSAFCVLWLIVLLRLLLPFPAPSPTSIYTVPAALSGQPRPLLFTGTQAAAEQGLSFGAVMGIVWLAGAVLLGLYFAVTHIRSRRVYGSALPLELPFAKSWLNTHRLRRPIQIRYSDQIDGPLTYGFLWPVILLPKNLDWTDEQVLSFILAHETSHIRRFDALLKWLFAVALCIHWFNPLVWIFYVLANRDLELASDAAVLRQHGTHARQAYALTLVNMEEKRTGFAPLASSFNRQALKERLTAVMRTRRASALSLGVALVLVCGVALLFATSAPAKELPTQENLAVQGGTAAAEGDQAAGTGGGNHATQVTVEDGALWGDEGFYTQEQYDALINALPGQGYENLSIAEFNRKVNGVLNTEDNDMRMVYEIVVSALPDADPNAAYLRNTVSASLQEYQARLEEAYSGAPVFPEFWGQARVETGKSVFQQPVKTIVEAQYTVKYQILDQNALTVGARDAFLQAVMAAAQTALKDVTDSGGGQAEFTEAFLKLAAACSNEKIAMIRCNVENVDVLYDY